jgi:hypothetical protein
MTFEEYLDEVERTAVAYPEWRDGQLAFNVLYMVYPQLAEMVRGRIDDLDPYYRDENLPRFTDFVKANWPLDPERRGMTG